MLHILNGDGMAATFRTAGFEGEVLVWREALVMGPCPAVGDSEWIDLRANHLVDFYDAELNSCKTSLASQIAIIDNANQYDEVVLWFEPDLFCRVNMLNAINRLAKVTGSKCKISLAGHEIDMQDRNFKGYGSLNTEELALLFESRLQYSSEMLSLATRAWRAYANSAPQMLVTLVEENNPENLKTRQALHRHLARFPSLKNGLGTIENALLNLIAGGVDEFEPLFHMLGDIEPLYGFGDAQVWRHLYAMGNADNPLLLIGGLDTSAKPPTPIRFAETYFKLTRFGKAVLVGNSDMLNINSVDYWLGGVHITNDIAWRWNEESERLQKI